jgi:hypothetical protein
MRIASAGALIVLVAGAPAQSQSIGDFEGSLYGWVITGEAFNHQPTAGNNIAPRRPGETPGQSGNNWIGSYENRPSESVPLGRVQGDGPQGEMLSPKFAIESRSIDFLIGGGSDLENERVTLLVKQEPDMPPPGRPGMIVHLSDGDYVATSSETGRNDEHMHRVTWTLSPGMLHRWARIQIVDHASGPWGHINVDDFHGIDLWTPTEADLPPNPDAPPSGLGTAVPVGHEATAPAFNIPRAGTNAGRAVVVIPENPSLQADPVPPPVPAHRYRLVATGFYVGHQTVDDMLERDGPGDEIFVRADVLSYHHNGQFIGRLTRKSAVFGARNDIRAGSAHQWNSADDQPGGFVTNDRYPLGTRQFSTTHRTRPNDLPLILWEGELQSDDYVLVIPSIWEWDSAGQSNAETAWEQGLASQAETLAIGGPLALNVNGEAPRRQSIKPSVLREPLLVFDQGTRPIGATPSGGEPRSGPAGINPTGIILSADLNEGYLAQSHTVGVDDNSAGTAVYSELQLPPGALEIRLRDPREIEGQYDLYLMLERLP